MRRVLIVLWMAVAVLIVTGCTETETVLAPSQVMLRVYNNDDVLLGQMSALSVNFSLDEGSGRWRDYAPKSFSAKELAWPVDVPLIPGDGEDENRQFEVVLRAHAGDTVLAEARAVTSFVRGKRLLLEVWLYRCPGHEGPFVCAAPACHGSDCTVCGPSGACVPTGVTSTTDLSPLDPQDVPDGKPTPGWLVDTRDASTPGRDGSATTCVEDDLRCDPNADGQRQRCQADAWVAGEACPDGQFCDPQSEPAGQCRSQPCSGDCAACTEAEQRCAAEASAEREVCQEGKFVPLAACGSGELCDHSAASPGDCSPVVEGCADKAPGTAVCLGSTRIVCGRDLVSVTGTPQSCVSAEACEQGTGGACAQCVTGEHACEGQQLQICNETRTGFVSVGSPCTAGAPCNKELGMCTAQTCKPNAWSCSGDTLRHCNANGTDYVTSDTEACGPSLCNATGQRCNDCQPSKISCLEEGGKGRQQCNTDGRGWSSYTACGSACLLGNCVACAPTSTRCDPASALQHRQTCSPSGAWGTGDDCSRRTRRARQAAAAAAAAAAVVLGRTSAPQKDSRSIVAGTASGVRRSPAAPTCCVTRARVFVPTTRPSPGGASAPPAEAPRDVRSSQLLATPVLITEEVRLHDFGLITAPAADGGNVSWRSTRTRCPGRSIVLEAD